MAQEKFDYQAKSRELDYILQQLQDNNALEVDEAIEMYEHAIKLAKEIEAYLKQAENKVTKIKADWEARAKQ